MSWSVPRKKGRVGEGGEEERERVSSTCLEGWKGIEKEGVEDERAASLNKRSRARGNLLDDWRRSFLLVSGSSASVEE